MDSIPVARIYTVLSLTKLLTVNTTNVLNAMKNQNMKTASQVTKDHPFINDKMVNAL